MLQLKIMVGNVGTGKSLLSHKFAQMGDVVINNDLITSMVQGGEYGAYDYNKKPVYKAIESAGIESALDRGFSVCIDRTNMTKSDRAKHIDIGRRYKAEIVAYNFGEGDNKSYERRIMNPGPIENGVWTKVHNDMRESYEPPTLDEGFEKVIVPLQSFIYHAFDFDGTIIKLGSFPEPKELIQNTVDKIDVLFKNLANIIIVWSCRSGESERIMRRFLIKNKVKFDFINHNPMFNTGSRKIFAHHYYDDRNGDIKDA